MKFARFEDIQQRWTDLQQEVAIRCELVKLVYVWRGRNTWGGWGTWYYTQTSFCPNLPSAKRVAERNRVQGTRWYLRELPACLLHGSRQSLVLTEINTDHPLLGRTIEGLEDFSLYSIAKSFNPRKPNSVVRLVLDSGVQPGAGRVALPLYDENLRRFTSFSRGGRKIPLGWSREEQYKFNTLTLTQLASVFDALIPNGLTAAVE